jgi:upstream activation factor subunit UAF30
MAKAAKKPAKKIAPKKVAAKKAAPKKAAPKKAVPKPVAKKAVAKKATAKKTTPKKATEKKAAPKKVKRKVNPALMAPLTPGANLAAIIGNKPIVSGQMVKKLWDYFKKKNLQDPKNKRMINADALLKPLFGKAQVSMFEIGGIISKNAK